MKFLVKLLSIIFIIISFIILIDSFNFKEYLSDISKQRIHNALYCKNDDKDRENTAKSVTNKQKEGAIEANKQSEDLIATGL